MGAEVAALFARIQVNVGEALANLRAMRSAVFQVSTDFQTMRDQARISAQGVDASLKGISKSVTTSTNGLGEKLSSPFTTMKGAVSTAGGLIATEIIGKFTELTSGAAEMVGNYEQNMAVFQLVTKASGKDMDDATAKIKELSQSALIPFDRAQISGALTTLARGGLSAADSMKALEPALLLAAAGEAKAEEGAATLASTLQIFQLPANDAMSVADKLTATMKYGGLSFQDMTEEVKIAGPAFAAAGVSIDDLATMMILFGQNGMKGSMAGTELRNVIQTLRAPTEEQMGNFKGIGVALFDANNKARPFRDILADLRIAFSKRTEAEQYRLAKVLFGESYGSMLKIIKGGEGTFDKASSQVQQQGLAAELAGKKSDNFGGAMKNLNKEVRDTSMAAFEPLVPVLQTLALKLIDVMQWFQNLPAPIRGMVGVALLLAPILGAIGLAGMGLGVIFGGIGTIVGGVIGLAGGLAGMAGGLGVLSAIFTGLGTAAVGLVTIVGTAFAALLTPIGLAIAAVGLLVLAWVNNWFGIRDKAKGLLDAGIGIITGLFDGIKQGWTKLSSAVSNFDPVGWIMRTIVNPIRNFFRNNSPSLWMAENIGAPLAEGILQGFNKLIGNIGGAIGDFATTVKTKFSTAMSNIATVLGDTWTTVKTTIGNKLTDIGTSVGDFATTLKTKFTTAVGNIGAAISDTWTTVKTTVGTKLTDIGTSLSDFATTAKTKFTTAVGNIGSTIGDTWATVKTTVGTKLSDIGTSLGEFGSTVKTKFTTAVGNIGSTLGDTWTTVKTGVSTKLTEIGTTLGEFGSTVKDKVTTGVGNIGSGIGGVFDTLETSAGTVLTNIGSTLGDVGGKFTTFGTTVKDSIATGVGGVLDTLKTNASTILTNIGSSLGDLGDKFKAFGANVKDAITTGAGGVLDNFGTKVKDLVSGPIKSLGDKLGGIAGSLGISIPGRASGGPVTGGQVYLVGESGPELFAPGASGVIIPNQALAGAGGAGGGSTVQVIFQGPVYGMDDFQTRVRQAAEVAQRRGGR